MLDLSRYLQGSTQHSNMILSSTARDGVIHARMLNRRSFAVAGLSSVITGRARGGTVLRVGDQKGGMKSLMAASGALAGFEDQVEWRLFAAAAPLLEALNAGAIDCGGVGDAPFAFARAAGIRAKAVAGTRSSGASTALLVQHDSTYRNFADLRGRTIGTGKGSVGHFLALAARNRAGLSPSDIKFRFLAPADAKAAFVSGSIEAWSTWSQYVWLAVAQDHSRILLDGRGLMSGLSYTVASEQAIAQKRAVLRAFVSRLGDALRWGLAHVDVYASAWAAETGVPYEVSRQTLLTRDFTPVPIDSAMTADQQRVVDLYTKEHILPASYDAAIGFDSSFNS